MPKFQFHTKVYLQSGLIAMPVQISIHIRQKAIRNLLSCRVNQ